MEMKYLHIKQFGAFFIVDGIAAHPHKVDLIVGEVSDLRREDPVAMIDMTSAGNWRRHMAVGTNLLQAGKGAVYVYKALQIP